MEDKTYLVRIGSRFDTESDWESLDPLLLEGEIAIVSCKSDMPNAQPEIRIKCGDGIHKYSELPFINANASDVFNWAKQKNKPIYSADEIIGLEDFPHTHAIEDIIGLQDALDKKGDSTNSDGSSDGVVGENGKILASADGGLKVTQSGEDVIIGINDKLTFILDGGDSTDFQS